jgi:hypothetical protein
MKVKDFIPHIASIILKGSDENIDVFHSNNFDFVNEDKAKAVQNTVTDVT